MLATTLRDVTKDTALITLLKHFSFIALKEQLRAQMLHEQALKDEEYARRLQKEISEVKFPTYLYNMSIAIKSTKIVKCFMSVFSS